MATLVLLGIGVILFVFVDSRSHSTSDTLLGFAPWAIMMMTLFDMLCFRYGEYPAWWKRPPVK